MVPLIGTPAFNATFCERVRTPAAARAKLDELYALGGVTIESATNFMQAPQLICLMPTLETMADLKAYLKFLTYMAKVVQVAYRAPKQHWWWPAPSRALDRLEDHQLRYYLAYPVVDLIERKQWRRPQVERILWRLTFRRVKHPGATYHNRGVPDQTNVKVVAGNYHLELIFDADDQIVSMWSALKHHQVRQADGGVWFDVDPAQYTQAELKHVANTESFNYANHGGVRHNALDVDPSSRYAGFEPYLRNQAKRAFES